MTVKSPEDVEGREVPPDTAKLSGAGGNAHDITRWAYTTDSHAGNDAAGRRRAAADTFERPDPEPMYPTTPDSWERLGEDLTAFDDGQTYGPCHYFHESGDDCMSCPARDDACADAVMRDVASRIRNLRGGDR